MEVSKKIDLNLREKNSFGVNQMDQQTPLEVQHIFSSKGCEL